MDLQFQHLLPEGFHANSRVWIYRSSRLFGMGEALQIETILDEFVAQWNSHGTPVKGFATLLFGQFIIIMADETATGVSGCSTDSSVRIIKEIEKTFGVNMFDRQMLAFYYKEKVQLLPLAQLKHAMEHGFIDADTLYFNDLVQTKDELEKNWIIPIRQSWLAKKLQLQP